MSQAGDRQDWLAVGVAGGATMPRSFPAEVHHQVTQLAASEAWAAWWATTGLPPIDVDYDVGTQPARSPGAVRFRRLPARLHATMFSLAGEADLRTIDARAVVGRDLSHLFDACVERFGIAVPQPPGELPTPPTRTPGAISDTEESGETILELHLPLLTDPEVAVGAYPFPWLLELEEHLAELEEAGEFELLDDGEELGEEYVFWLGGRPGPELIAAASRVASRPGSPAGVYAIMSSSSGFGVGERIALPRTT